MDADSIRCSIDKKLFENLLEERDVKRMNEHLAELEESGTGTKVRRHLLATSVRLSPIMAPKIHRLAEHCREAPNVAIPIELYVYASPQFNAACVKPEDGRLFIMFSSSLLEAFPESELRFVMGHELGHYLYRHHDIPIGYLLRGERRPSPKLALKLFAWSRYAEVSADRAGALCARDLAVVGRSLFRLTSGLSDEVVDFDFDEFLHQVDEMALVDGELGQGAPQEDWFSTHPFSPLRVKALSLYFNSEFAPEPVGMTGEELEVAVQGVMSLMEPSYLEGRTDTAEAMRRLLFAGAIVIADASDGISEEEIAVFEKFFGSGAFSEKLAADKLRTELPSRIQQVRDLASPPQRLQVLRDLCIVARADNKTSKQERAVLDEIAVALDVSTVFVTQTLAHDGELD